MYVKYAFEALKACVIVKKFLLFKAAILRTCNFYQVKIKAQNFFNHIVDHQKM